FMIECETQEEIDYYWDSLIAGGGEEGPCGWCKDRYGRSWQVCPTGMAELFADPDQSRAERAMTAMFGMKKLDIAALKSAADGVPAAGRARPATASPASATRPSPSAPRRTTPGSPATGRRSCCCT